eukprot:COSAG05_NODE_3605_length_1964_cov_24.012332_1_plen_253_part_00
MCVYKLRRCGAVRSVWMCVKMETAAVTRVQAQFSGGGAHRLAMLTALLCAACTAAVVEAVACEPFEAMRPLNTKYSHQDNTEGQENYEDDALLAQHHRCHSERYPGFGAVSFEVMDYCDMECLAGWYPAADPKPAWVGRARNPAWSGTNAKNRTVRYTCSEPLGSKKGAKDEAGNDCPLEGSTSGVWCPGPCCTGSTKQVSSRPLAHAPRPTPHAPRPTPHAKRSSFMHMILTSKVDGTVAYSQTLLCGQLY